MLCWAADLSSVSFASVHFVKEEKTNAEERTRSGRPRQDRMHAQDAVRTRSSHDRKKEHEAARQDTIVPWPFESECGIS